MENEKLTYVSGDELLPTEWLHPLNDNSSLSEQYRGNYNI